MSIVTNWTLDISTCDSANTGSNVRQIARVSHVRSKPSLAHFRLSVAGLVVVMLGSLGCASTTSSFEALQRAFPVSANEVTPQRLLIDGQEVGFKGLPLTLKYAAKAPITIAGTVADGVWKLGGTGTSETEGDFAWCPSVAVGNAVEISSDPGVMFICKVHHLQRWTPKSLPTYALCSFRPHPLRNGGHFEVHFFAPPKPGDYAIDVSAEIHYPRTESPKTDIPPKVSVFFRAKLHVD